MSIIGNYIHYNRGPLKAIRKFLAVLMKLVTTQGLFGIHKQLMETRLRMQQMDYERSRANALLSYHATRVLRIIATHHTAYVAYMLDMQFSQFGITSKIYFDPKHKPDKDALYLVICPQMLTYVPRHMIVFQMEQSTSTRWFTTRYLKLLQQSIAIIDYSSHNLEYLQALGFKTGSLYLYPVCPIPNYREYLATRGINFIVPGTMDVEVSFYGDINCERRRTILKELSRNFRIQVISNLFGADLLAALLRSRVVLNIHYYESALLETTRISECVSMGIPVVSESGMPSERHEEFGGLVRYVPSGDISAMAKEIASLLNQNEPRNETYCSGVELEQATTFSTARFLVGCGLIDASELLSRPSGITLSEGVPICLSLPETPLRRKYAELSCIEQPRYFDGLRHVQGWKGCALSYWYLTNEAKRQGMSQLEVYEDDCQFFPNSHDALRIARQYLLLRTDQWDIFSGLITSIPNDASILKVEIYQGIKFVHLNRTLSTVYNIFNHSIYDYLASWNVSNDDSASNTIDKYLASKPDLKVITCLPYIIGHAEEIDSTLWGFGNQAYSKMIATSNQELSELASTFEVSSMRL